ncbi:MAG TPA: peptidoglycan-associated lipoprotein Pal [Burkholderiales bacterium]|jgi:peptidoglycan-associated lipoprotein
MKRYVLPLLVAAMLAACSSTPKNNVPIKDATTTSQGNNNGADADRIPPVVAPTADEELMQGVLAKRSVYFDLDSFVVKDEYRSLVEAHANFMKRHGDRRVVIEGNTDERGSREYNLALGQKRSEAVRRALATLGVPDRQVEAISYGEERPKATGHDETAWAENRRADITYPK